MTKGGFAEAEACASALQSRVLDIADLVKVVHNYFIALHKGCSYRIKALILQ